MESLEYAPVGFGSYHWSVTGVRGLRWFVTVDDLDRKPWLGDAREAAFDGLRCAFDTAAALREAGLGFVVAPFPSRSGETVRRLGERHTVAVFPFVAGTGAEPDSTAQLAMLAELHRATPAVRGLARRWEPVVPDRARLEAALADLGGPWTGGPFSEPAREALAPHAGDVGRALLEFDRRAAAVASAGGWVITHGEPHPGNLVQGPDGVLLVDWDTVALAPPERDLWMAAATSGAELDAYREATGHEVDPAAVELFRLAWDLADIAAFVDVLRSPHGENADTAKAYDGLALLADVRRRLSGLLDES